MCYTYYLSCWAGGLSLGNNEKSWRGKSKGSSPAGSVKICKSSLIPFSFPTDFNVITFDICCSTWFHTLCEWQTTRYILIFRNRAHPSDYIISFIKRFQSSYFPPKYFHHQYFLQFWWVNITKHVLDSKGYVFVYKSSWTVGH